MFYFITLLNATDVRSRTNISGLRYMTCAPHLKVFQTKRFIEIHSVHTVSHFRKKLDKHVFDLHVLLF